MATITIEIGDIPHGHGGSFKRGVAEALLEKLSPDNRPNGQDRSHARGRELGFELAQKIGECVRP